MAIVDFNRREVSRLRIHFRDGMGKDFHLTAWSAYAGRGSVLDPEIWPGWVEGQTYILVDIEENVNVYGATRTRQMNIFWDTMVIPCIGDYADMAL